MPYLCPSLVLVFKIKQRLSGASLISSVLHNSCYITNAFKQAVLLLGKSLNTAQSWGVTSCYI